MSDVAEREPCRSGSLGRPRVYEEGTAPGQFFPSCFAVPRLVLRLILKQIWIDQETLQHEIARRVLRVAKRNSDSKCL